MVWSTEMRMSWNFHVGKSLCSPVSMWALLSMSNVRACDGNGKQLIFSDSRSIKLCNHSGKTEHANAHKWTNEHSHLATVASKNTWMWNGLCLWAKSAFNLLMPLSESIHFLQWIKKLLSHVLTLFCLLSIVCCCFRVYMHIKTVGYIALSKIEISTIICPKSIKLTKKWPICSLKS